MKCSSIAAFEFLVLHLAATPAAAAVLAADNAADAAYADGWQEGDNGGTGFEPWIFGTITGNAGLFIGSSTANGNGDTNASGDIDTNGKAFGLFANSGDTAGAIRPFADAEPLSVGQTFSIDFDNGLVDEGGVVAFHLLDRNLISRFAFGAEGFVNGAFAYLVVDGTGPGAHLISTTLTDDGMRVDVTLTGSTTYSMSINGAPTFSGTLVAGDPIVIFAIENGDAGSSPSHDGFFNSIAVTAVPEPASCFLAMLALTAAMVVARLRLG